MYRPDGVRITHNPFAPGMAEKYGTPGHTDNEGFDPYADTVGPGIYGGIVKRDAEGNVVIGRQYQNHNPRPGPVYAGGGYAPISKALRSPSELEKLLSKYPDLVNSITTGGAQPLHMAGMGRDNEKATAFLIQHGGDIEAIDTYGMTPLHRMASNNLGIGAKALLEAGADPNYKGKVGESPLATAKSSHALKVIEILNQYKTRLPIFPTRVTVDLPENVEMYSGSIFKDLVGTYNQQPASQIPEAFGAVCESNGWVTKEMWSKLNGSENPWYKHSDNESYIYYNKNDKQWWIDGTDGMGVFIARSDTPYTVPSLGWQLIHIKGPNSVLGDALKPQVRCYRDGIGA